MTSLVTTEVVGNIAIVQMHRPPTNFFNLELLGELGDAIIALDAVDEVRSVVLCSEGRHFCAGADLRDVDENMTREVYRRGYRLFTGRKPIVAAVQGAAVGGGLGLAMTADFRVAAADARLTANFAKLGFHHGFGLTATLPRAVGQQRALELLYTGRDVTGVEAVAIGLCDAVAEGDPLPAAIAFAERIALCAPLSVPAIRSTMRRQLLADVAAAVDVEVLAQSRLMDTADFREGVSAAVEKRAARFIGA